MERKKKTVSHDAETVSHDAAAVNVRSRREVASEPGNAFGPTRVSSGLAFGFLEDPLCKVFALIKLLRKTPCSGLEPGKPLFQRFSWSRFFRIVKFTLFFRGVCPQNRKVAPQATFLAPQAKLFGPERLGSQENPFFGPKKPLVQHFAPPGENPLCSIWTPCSA